VSNAEEDDGRLVSRRAALGAMGVLGLGAIGASAGTDTSFPDVGPSRSPKPACVLAPELTEGPFYLSPEVRRDITEGYRGVPLLLRATVVNNATCRPIRDAALDIWHCNAVGAYSGYTASGSGSGSGSGAGASGGGPDGHQKPTDALRFLRGVRLTSRTGVAEFKTLYPGWYAGRAVHIHAKVHIGGTVSGRTYAGGHVAHTGQFFFAEELTRKVALLDPYRTNATARTTNGQDTIYRDGGSSGLLTLGPVQRGQKSITKGVLATIVVGVNP
jgi:protocatechuate 3,4-dioxygenase beta subunit